MTASLASQIIYPDSDGKPMADNTKQFRWIVLIKENLEFLFSNNPDIFVAGDLLWYPVAGEPQIRIAPDVMVVFGRPPGDRGSYKQWEENEISPQVVFEILSPGNTLKEMVKKQFFYDHYGVEEYYIYNPDKNELTGLQRLANGLEIIEEMNAWVSPRLGIKFVIMDDTLGLYYPDGSPFLTTLELRKQVTIEKERADAEAQRADTEAQRASQAELELAQLKDLLKQQGLDIPNVDLT